MQSHNDIDITSPTHQDKILQINAEKCNNGVKTMPNWCAEFWDNILCWPSTAPGELAVVSCPNYIAGFDPQENASRQCMPDGQWYWSPETKNTWSNYTQCYKTPYVTVVMDITGVQPDNNVTLPQKYLPILKIISQVGYSISLTTLIVAFIILAVIKKLRCPRNMLHMHLFASFMMRAFMALLKDIIFVSGIGLASDSFTKDGESYLLENKIKINWQCKAFTSLWEYFFLANYFWVLMEGVYLHNLVFMALFMDAGSSIISYVIAGWGLPAIFISAWIALRAVFEDTLCWTTHSNTYLFLVIQIPTVLSNLINFVLFVRIVRVLFLKLKSTISEETQRYKQWARSTLVLVPLFGVHYTILLTMYSIGVNETVELVWLFCAQLFGSFQGFFVAVLYCLLNGEVRTELSRSLRTAKWTLQGRWGARRSTHSSSTCSCNVAKLGKHSRDGKWWRQSWSCNFHSEEARRSRHFMASTQDIDTRGGSLGNSRDYLESSGQGINSIQENSGKSANHTLCGKFTDQSLLSFCSNVSDASGCTKLNAEKIHDQRERWSDSECCHLTYELHNLPHHGHH